MAQGDFTPSPVFRAAAPKARMTVYFAMLIIALVAMLTACVFMFLELRRFGGFGAVPGRVTSLEPVHSALIAESAPAAHPPLAA
jgi:hypothetical protein